MSRCNKSRSKLSNQKSLGSEILGMLGSQCTHFLQKRDNLKSVLAQLQEGFHRFWNLRVFVFRCAPFDTGGLIMELKV
jgi:hypothetical protein